MLRRWKRRKSLRSLGTAMPELMARMAADPHGMTEKVADDEVPMRVHEASARDQETWPCVAVELGGCEGPVNTYERPRQGDGYAIGIRACDYHQVMLQLSAAGFVRIELPQ